MRGRAVGVKFERAGHVRDAVGTLHFGSAPRHPVRAVLDDFEVLFAHLLRRPP